MLEWKARLLTVMVTFVAFLDRVSASDNWNW